MKKYTNIQRAYLEALDAAFNAAYEGLYNGTLTAPGAVSSFDDELAENADFAADLGDFNEYRRDIITSDREAAAFWLAWKEVC